MMPNDVIPFQLCVQSSQSYLATSLHQFYNPNVSMGIKITGIYFLVNFHWQDLTHFVTLIIFQHVKNLNISHWQFIMQENLIQTQWMD